MFERQRTGSARQPDDIIAIDHLPQASFAGRQRDQVSVQAQRIEVSSPSAHHPGSGPGHFNADAPLSSGLYLAPGPNRDGVLTVGDLYSLRLDADLVTLSACETGLGKVVNGDDVIGLTRGFLYAGARTIVASLWEVDDAATAQLMESFYKNLGAHDKREALRLAQIETRNSHPDPWYWAGFNVIGKGD